MKIDFINIKFYMKDFNLIMITISSINILYIFYIIKVQNISLLFYVQWIRLFLKLFECPLLFYWLKSFIVLHLVLNELYIKIFIFLEILKGKRIKNKRKRNCNKTSIFYFKRRNKNIKESSID
ncbi:hypothetical protein BCR36DRAFT_375483 [Piromyces finnis]|uniref:Uncharacterized protein n=1 Tax=Piromyces finnis TaxID=1754191 RepID=A0A1Y1UQU4_9FUNG|nr:hypothetical protein BCR36DRAFT_375483 [Piromyces finnis]|eukprot:ORX40359.1 hypothetical protein BCR36DRAFT_375483 [Piromyces finnis]